MPGAALKLPLAVQFAWDIVDLGIFVFWMVAYGPHVAEVDSSSFYGICTLVIILGAAILIRGLHKIMCNGLGGVTLRSIWETYKDATLLDGKFYLNKYKEVAQHMYWELVFDLVQVGATMWMIARITLINEEFKWKLLIDFLNVGSTVVDIIMFKGPEAVDLTGCDLGMMAKALLGTLPTYRAMANGAPPPDTV